MIKTQTICIFILSLLFLSQCRGDDYIIRQETELVTIPTKSNGIVGFYLLNEGIMGSNKATLDKFDYLTGVYHRNIFSEINPNITKELGDVGNDIKIYGNKLYIILNISNKIEVLNAKNGKRITSIPLENCRYITFNKGKAYVSSYTGKVRFASDTPLGKVVQIDTTSLVIEKEAIVGYQPEELEIIDNQLFVANSGGYRAPNYDDTISVIDLNNFTEKKKIKVAINLHHLKKDSEKDLYVTSRGNYNNIPANLLVINSKDEKIKKKFNLPISNFTIVNDKLYFISNNFNYNKKNDYKFGIINTTTEEITNEKLINDKIIQQIRQPYGIAVNPITEEIFITDASNFISSGAIYCFDKNGKFKWKTIAGNIPAHIAFYHK